MTDTANISEPRSLAQMRVADLQAMASKLGIKGAARMRKSVLIDAIEQAQRGDTPRTELAKPDSVKATTPAEPVAEPVPPAASAALVDPAGSDQSAVLPVFPELAQAAQAVRNPAQRTRRSVMPAGEQQGRDDAPSAAATAQSVAELELALTEAVDAAALKTQSGKVSRNRQLRELGQRGKRSEDVSGREETQPQAPKDEPLTLEDIVLPPARDEEAEAATQEEQPDGAGRKRNRNRNRNRSGDDNSKASGNGNGRSNNQNASNQSTGLERKRKRNRDDVDPEIAPDDVLLPIAGILDVLDNYAFVRTSSYLPGSNDVYVSLGQVKKYNLRKGDAIVGAIRQPREGEQPSGRQKYNALVKIDTVNGEHPEPGRERADFDKLTALYPDQRITLETAGGHAAQRMIDLFAPIGKGTRGLIVAPPRSGKSIMLERIANAIASNYPETHLMLVLVDERPEEVTRLERTIHGEVISSTFDMPAENHTTIAELAIERAKRLVELGLDVVVLLDSITQLCRAYNVTAPASGRIIAGGVDQSAVYPPKRIFGAARNVENGGSLTILATAMVETGSRTDEVILEEFAGTANMELRLSREIANRRIFPALDIEQSSTLHEEQLLGADELEATWSIRRALVSDAQVSLEAVLERISQTSSNSEFLASVRATPITPVVVR